MGGLGHCFVWINSSISVFPKLFNCWRAMRQEASEFNVKNHFHFSPPTIERFNLVLVNDTLHWRALYDLLCATERTPRSLQIPTIPSFSPSHVSPALESKSLCLKSQVLHYLGVVEDYKCFTTCALKKSIEKSYLLEAFFMVRGGSTHRM